MSGRDAGASANQPPPFENVDLFGSDSALKEAVAREGRSGTLPRAAEFGRRMGSAEVAELARQAHTHLPELHRYDRYGTPLDEVEYHRAYHALMRIAVESGMASAPWEAAEGGYVTHAALEYLLAEVEPSTCCPLTMTFAAVPVLRRRSDLAAAWEAKILARHYDPRSCPISEKAGLTVGMAMTEKQGGSDLRANETRAEAAGETYMLTGHKWFCSAPMSDGFLTLAQAPGGLTCFLAPRFRADGTHNAIEVLRLKDKIGDRANASAEIAYEGAEAWRIGEEGRGIATILDMVHHTRLDCAIAPAAYMRAAAAQALWFAEHRRAFGKRLIEHDLMRAVLADLVIEAEAAAALVFRLARSFDEGPRSEAASHLARIATPVAKYWLNKCVTGHVAEAMECHGGAGYVLDWPIAWLYRQAPLNGIWEGSGNIVCLDVLRALQREPATRDALLAELALAKGANATLDRAISEAEDLLVPGALAEAGMRYLVERLALTLQAALLMRHAPAFVADAFCASRLAERGGKHYGVLPAGADPDAIVARAMPVV